MQRIATFLACGFYRIGVALLATLLAANCVQAQTPTPTAEQMEIFRNLPPDQQQAILESLGTSGSGSASRDGGVRRDRDLKSPETVRPDGTTNGRDGAEGREDGEDVTAGYDYLSDYYSGRMQPREPRIRANDSVLLDVRLKQVDPAVDRARSPQEKRRIEEMLERTLRSNPYKLDANGVLRIPGIEPIPLAGLKEDQATERLKRDPAMRDFEIELTLLPLEKLDAEALKPFGYDLFAGTPSTFAPVTDVPVPSEYVVGPGDRFEVQLIGTTKGRYSLVVNRDGRVMFPELGPIAVSGLQFDEAKNQIQARVNDQMIGTQAIISMGELRSIRVFVLGEAQRPGSYTVSGLATITNALFASGGIKKIGSLRDIQVKRNDKIIKRLDLYELLMNGRTSSDVRLLPGDVIFIPPVGRTVAVTGEIRRPAIYELKGESSVAELVHLGGGLTPEADPRLANIERLDERRDRVVISVDLGNAQARSTPLRSGDLLRIPRARPTFANAIQLKGHVHRPSSYQYRSGMRVTDVLPSIEELKPNADLHYVLIRRERPGTRQVQALSVDLERAWSMPATDADPLLEPRDQLLVFDLETGRKQYLDPVIDDLKLQAVSSQPSHIVRVTGRVRAEGEYPLEVGMTLSDLIRAGGGLAEQAYGGEAELARYEVRDGQTRQTTVLKVDLAGVLAGDPAADLVLGPFDTLVVKEISEWSEQEVVRLEGEVRFPGDYPIARGETLRALIARAGGLTPWAFTQGSLFTRDTLKERERQQIKLLADRMQQDLGSLALQSSQTGGPMGSQAAETLAIGRSLLDELKAAEPVGRLVIDLDRVLAAEAGSSSDLMLKSGDRLRVPRRAQEVTVIGEVQNSTSHLYDPAYARDDYLRMSGGTTKKADDKRIYVVRANGSVEAGTGSRWFQSAGGDIRPGDTIVVPLDAERMRPLPLWTSVSTIIYNLAVAVAAVGSFD